MLRNINKKKLGEVFTPPSLAEEMVDLLTDIKYDDTFLDPCCGATAIFPIFLMFKWVNKFGNQNVMYFVKNMYMVEMNESACEYGEMIFRRYVYLTKEYGVDFSKQHYIKNFNKIVDDYYDFCETEIA